MILNSSQLGFLTSASYEYKSRIKTIANASRNWFELFHFVKLFRMQLSNQNEYIDQNSILTFFNSSLFIINRIEHIESKKSVDSIIHDQNKIFDVFVQIHRSDDTTSHKMQLEQWARINSALSKIKTYAKISTMKFANFRIMNLTNFEFNEHTNRSISTQRVWRIRNESWTCNRSWTCNKICNWAKNHFIILFTF